MHACMYMYVHVRTYVHVCTYMYVHRCSQVETGDVMQELVEAKIDLMITATAFLHLLIDILIRTSFITSFRASENAIAST